MLFADAETNALVKDIILGFFALLSTALGLVMAYMTTRLNMQINAQKVVSKGLEEEKRDLQHRASSNEKIRDEAVEAATEMAAYVLKKEGKQPMIPVIAPVVTQSNSPSTEKQRHEARIATAIAKLAAAKLAVGIAPRPEPEHAVENNKDAKNGNGGKPG